jgi:hypothetical protein
MIKLDKFTYCFLFFVLYLDFFTMFKEKYFGVQVMWSKFQSLKLWFVRKLHELNSCCCRYHIEINELKQGLNGIKSRAKGSMGSAIVLVHKFITQVEKILVQ